jgi:hypothetical protein
MNDMSRRFLPPPNDPDEPARQRHGRTAPFGVLDIGTTKIVCLIGRTESDGTLRALGFGWQRGSGVRGGGIVDAVFFGAADGFESRGGLAQHPSPRQPGAVGRQRLHLDGREPLLDIRGHFIGDDLGRLVRPVIAATRIGVNLFGAGTEQTPYFVQACPQIA